MTDERKQCGKHFALRAIAPLTICLSTTMPMPVCAAEVLPPGVAASLQQAAERDVDAFRAALRAAIAAAPDRKDATLRHALAAHPQRAAELLLAGLYDPPLQAPAIVRALPVATGGAAAETAAALPAVAGGVAAETTAAPPAVAQGVDDKPEAIEEAGPWNGTIVLGATARTGNTDNTGTTAEVTITYLGGSWTHRGRASVDYLRNRAQTQEQAFEGEYEAQYDLDHRHFSYGLARYEDDRFSGFDYEFTAAAGLGRHLVREPGHEWTVTLGPSFRQARPSDEQNVDRALGARFTNLLSWELSDNARLENQTEALADSERVRVNNDVILKLRIIDQLSGQISFGFQYRSDTPEEAEHTDTTTRATVVYDF